MQGRLILYYNYTKFNSEMQVKVENNSFLNQSRITVRQKPQPEITDNKNAVP